MKMLILTVTCKRDSFISVQIMISDMLIWYRYFIKYCTRYAKPLQLWRFHCLFLLAFIKSAVNISIKWQMDIQTSKA